MGSLVGFSAFRGLRPNRMERALLAQTSALASAPKLGTRTLDVGLTRLDLWGHGELSDRVHTLPDGSILALIGSPHEHPRWPDVGRSLLAAGDPARFSVPWDGRVLLLRVSAAGDVWTVWNDWVGSISVFHLAAGEGHVASTLEPVVVAAGGFTSADVFGPGLVSLLLNGHFLSDWTLFNGMKAVPPDSVSQWLETGFRSTPLATIQPTTDHCGTTWDALADEMHDLAEQAIVGALRQHPRWLLPLSSGLDSRLLAAVGARAGIEMRAYTWGEPDSTDVVYAKRIAGALEMPWTHVELPPDFLVTYTPRWADWFGSGLHFHGMYQMAFLDRLNDELPAPVVSGWLGDSLAGDVIHQLLTTHDQSASHHCASRWWQFWSVDLLRRFLRIDVEDALEANLSELQRQQASLPGERFQRLQFMELWGRQRRFVAFQADLADYWRTVSTPFVNRAYARFSMGLPLVALDDRRLLVDVFRRHYGLLATIPGTYGDEPMTLTGRFLLGRRLKRALPERLRHGLRLGAGGASLRMDSRSVQAHGRQAVWPLFDVWKHLGEWCDPGLLERDVEALQAGVDDVVPLRRLQAVQAVAYRLHVRPQG